MKTKKACSGLQPQWEDKGQHPALSHYAKRPPVGKWWTVRNKYFITWLSYNNKLLAYIPAFKNIHSSQKGENMELPDVKERSRGYSMKMSIEEKKVLVSWRPWSSPHCTQLWWAPVLPAHPPLHHLDREGPGCTPKATTEQRCGKLSANDCFLALTQHAPGVNPKAIKSFQLGVQWRVV